MNNNIQIVLQILPDMEKNTNHDLIKISDNYVVLSNTPKTLLFQFDHVFNANVNQEQYHNYFYNHIPNITLRELLQGNDTSIIIYSENTAVNSFDMSLIEAYSDLFESNMTQIDIFISFFEFHQNSNNTTQRDLIASVNNQMHEYQINSIEQLKKYYLLGLNQHKQGQLSVFSITIKSNRKESRINIINITDDSTDILNQISDYLYFSPKSAIEKSPLLRILDQSQFTYFISSLHLNSPLSQIQQKLSFTSNIFQKLKKKSSLNLNLPKTNQQEDDIHYLKQVISRLSNEVYSLRQSKHIIVGRSESITSSSYHGSEFSAATYSTQLTSVDASSSLDAHCEKNEQLEQAYLAMRETNLELWAINEKQSEVIVRLETESSELREEMAGLFASVRAMGADKDRLVEECRQLTGMVERPALVKQVAIQKQRQLACLQRQLALYETTPPVDHQWLQAHCSPDVMRVVAPLLVRHDNTHEYLLHESNAVKKCLKQLAAMGADMVDAFPLPPPRDLQEQKQRLASAEKKIQAQNQLIAQLQQKTTKKKKRRFFCFL